MKQSLMSVLRLVGFPGWPHPFFIFGIVMWLLQLVAGIALFRDYTESNSLMKMPLFPVFMTTYILAFSFGLTSPGIFSPGFAWTLPRVRQRLVSGFGILAVIIGVVLGIPFLILAGPAAALIAGSAAAFVFLSTSLLSDVRIGRLRWAFALVYIVWWVPGIVAALRAAPTWLTITIPFGLALSIWARAYWPRHAEPRFERGYDFSGRDAISPRLAFLPRRTSPAPHPIQRNILRNSLRASFHERGYGVRRTLCVIALLDLVVIAACYTWIEPDFAITLLGTLYIPLGLSFPVAPTVTLPMSRATKARFVWSASALNTLAALTLYVVLIAMYLADPFNRWRSHGTVDLNAIMTFGALSPLVAIPLGQWAGTRLPMLAPPAQRIMTGFIVGIILSSVMAGPILALGVLGSTTVLWQELCGVIGVAVGVQLLFWRSLRRQYASRDLISG